MSKLRSRSCYVLLAALTFSLARIGAVEAQEEAAPPSIYALKAWRRSMAHSARPNARGCFETRYPDTTWAEVSCAIPPNIPLRPRHAGGARSQTVGDGTDFSAQTQTVAVTMEGSFDSVSGVTSETGAGTANSYTLQLNSEFFSTTTCTGGQSGCKGWEQFVFFNLATPSESIAFIQYWLIGYGASCPGGWTSDDGVDCYRNSNYGVVVPVQTIASLGQMALIGVAPSGGSDDSVSLMLGTTLYSVTGNAYFPDLAQHWNTSEFNVVGPGNSSQAVFNTGATIVVRTAGDSGTAAPSCVEVGFTAETNNLQLVTVVATEPDAAWPSIVFKQSNAGSATPATCVALPAAPTQESTDAPLPSWALIALGAGLVGIARRRLGHPRGLAVR